MHGETIKSPGDVYVWTI